mgnify:CR=1 FL=1
MNISPLSNCRSIRDARCGVARDRFGQNVIRGNQGKLLLDHVHIGFGGHHPEITDIAYRKESLYGHLYEGLADSKDIDELLWLFRCAHRPQPASDSTCHYYYVGIHKNFMISICLQS